MKNINLDNNSLYVVLTIIAIGFLAIIVKFGYRIYKNYKSYE